MGTKPVAAGKSSFDLIDKSVLAALDAKPGSSFLDLACGIGRYSIELSPMLGDKGILYAVDLWKEGIDALNKEIQVRNIANIKTMVADIAKEIPLKDSCIDACLMATILHDLSKDDQTAAIKETFRVLKPEGKLNIIEFKKIDNGPGPPMEIRMQEKDIDSLVSPYGFTKEYEGEAGAFHYLITYRKNKRNI